MNDKVYILIERGWPDSEDDILGVFSSTEKLKAFVKDTSPFEAKDKDDIDVVVWKVDPTKDIRSNGETANFRYHRELRDQIRKMVS